MDVYKGCHLNFCISIGLISAWVGQFCLNQLYRFIARKICLHRQKFCFIAQIDQLYRFITGKTILSRNLYRFIGDKNFGQKNCIALFDFFLKNCVSVSL
jgi:hypothetical protein